MRFMPVFIATSLAGWIFAPVFESQSAFAKGSGLSSWFCDYSAPGETLAIAEGKNSNFKDFQDFQDFQFGGTFENALWPAWLALLSYQNEKSFAKLGKVGLEKITKVQDHKTGTFGLVGETNTETILVFEGSTTPKDILIDLQFFPQEDSFKDNPETADEALPGKIHGGFLKASNSVWPQVKKLVSRNKPITLVGHSLGGALSTLVGLRLAILGYPVSGIYTFESPRVGNTEFAEQAAFILRDKFKRFENEWDVIPHLPPRRLASAAAVNSLPKNLLSIPLKNTLTRQLENANFSHIGNSIVFSPQGEPQLFEGDLHERDTDYYLRVQKRNTEAGSNLWNLAALQWRMFGDHFPFSSYCYIKKLSNK